MECKIADIRPHPKNFKIYGNEELPQDFLDSIRANGILVPLIINEDNTIISGHRRWRAAQSVGMETVPVEIVRYKDELAERDAIITYNRQREKTFSQRMAEAEEIKAIEADRARLRILASQNNKSGREIAAVEMFPQQEKGKTRDKVAQSIGLGSGRTYDKAARVCEAANQGDDTAKKLIRAIDQGKTTINKAYQTVVNQQKKTERDQAAQKSEEVVADPIQQKPVVKQGQWWKLGKHRIYCGDTSQPIFWKQIPSAAFAFADPPYNTAAAEWDKNFIWQHDWMTDKAAVVAVTPGIEGLYGFARITTMPYKWSLACWIDNGMTRGAVGFGNWIYISLFATGSVFRQAQDFVRVSINATETTETTHKGRKPSGLMAWLIGTYSSDGNIIIDPFLGSGTTLLVAEKMNRTCWGGEINPEFCADIIARWEILTGLQAEVMPHACNHVRAG